MAGLKSEQPPSKRTKLLDGSDEDSSADENGFKLKINDEYARRHEHNKRREEIQRLEEKHGSSATSKRKRDEDVDEDEDDDDSEDVSEDDDAELATAEVDEEIFATLEAIKKKDPRVYDSNVRFFKEFKPEDAAAADGQTKKAEKPMYLQDYHRENLLAGRNGVDDEEDDAPLQTYQQEQDALKQQLVGAMHATKAEEDDSDDNDDFLVAKSRSRHEDMPAAKTKKVKTITEADIQAADADPETYLSNFMASRAWLPGDDSVFKPLESDDSEDDARADEFEEAYNNRFEHPEAANEKLKSFARDVGKYGARREEKTARQRAREREKEQKEAAKREREEEKARLRKLKIEEAEEKVQRIKEAAGIAGKELDLDAWRDMIEGDFDDDKWEQEMKRRFGEDYYAQEDGDLDMEDYDDEEETATHKKAKKPKWDDDIDINDLVPDFEESAQPAVTLSSDDEAEDADSEQGESKKSSKKNKKATSIEAKRAARKERRAIEEMVDASLPISNPSLSNTAASSKLPVSGFRYQHTEPTSFGLSARDILFADDAQLNSYAGLKKLAPWRDEEKKARDAMRYSKSKRLKKWRKEAFGDTQEPTGGFERILGTEQADEGKAGKEGGKKRKRKQKKSKTAAA